MGGRIRTRTSGGVELGYCLESAVGTAERAIFLSRWRPASIGLSMVCKDMLTALVSHLLTAGAAYGCLVEESLWFPIRHLFRESADNFDV